MLPQLSPPALWSHSVGKWNPMLCPMEVLLIQLQKPQEDIIALRNTTWSSKTGVSIPWGMVFCRMAHYGPVPLKRNRGYIYNCFPVLLRFARDLNVEYPVYEASAPSLNSSSTSLRSQALEEGKCLGSKTRLKSQKMPHRVLPKQKSEMVMSVMRHQKHSHVQIPTISMISTLFPPS